MSHSFYNMTKGSLYVLVIFPNAADSCYSGTGTQTCPCMPTYMQEHAPVLRTKSHPILLCMAAVGPCLDQTLIIV